MKRFLRFLREPHGGWLAVIYIVSAVCIAGGVVFLVFRPEGWDAVMYAFDALMLLFGGYCIYTFIYFGRREYLRLAERSAVVHRFKYDFEWRTLVLSTGSALLATLIAFYYVLLSGLSDFVWYTALAIYYFVLVLTRMGVLSSRLVGRRKGENEREIRLRDAKSYLGGGGLLILLTSAFAGMTVLMIVQGYHHDYIGSAIFVAAAYAFWKMGFAVTNFVRAQRRDDLTVRTLRNVNMADALVSVFALQVAMLQLFGTKSEEFDPTVFNSVTAGVACALIVALGTYMIVCGCRAYLAAKEEADER